MDCLVLPVSMLTRCYTGTSRLRYQPLTQEGFACNDDAVRVVVGKEKEEFLVDPFVLQASPFRVLMESAAKKLEWDYCSDGGAAVKRVVLADVDAILFEHMLWLMNNDCSSLFQLNLKEIIDFYAQDF